MVILKIVKVSSDADHPHKEILWNGMHTMLYSKHGKILCLPDHNLMSHIYILSATDDTHD